MAAFFGCYAYCCVYEVDVGPFEEYMISLSPFLIAKYFATSLGTVIRSDLPTCITLTSSSIGISKLPQILNCTSTACQTSTDSTVRLSTTSEMSVAYSAVLLMLSISNLKLGIWSIWTL